MLIGFPTKYGTGIEIFGDEEDLKNLNEVTHIIRGDDDSLSFNMLINFSYETKKAYMEQRLKSPAKSFIPKNYLGFRLFWPEIIVSVNLLRLNAGYRPTDKNIQSVLYNLEYIVEEALKNFDLILGVELAKYLSFPIVVDQYLKFLVPEITTRALNEKNGIQRFKSYAENMKLLGFLRRNKDEFFKIVDFEVTKRNSSYEELNYHVQLDKLKFKW